MFSAPPNYPKKILVIRWLVQDDIPQRGHPPPGSAATLMESVKTTEDF